MKTPTEQFKDIINLDRKEMINWNTLRELLPLIDPNSTSLSSNDAYEPTVIFLVAERVDNSHECRQFITALLNDQRVNFFVKSPIFKNSAFLWAISRYYEKVDHQNYSDDTGLYRGIHQCPLYVEQLLNKIIDNRKLHPLLIQASESTAINTPLLMALKNANLQTVLKLIPYYNKESLLIKTIAGNTVLHLAAFFRLNLLVKAILDHAKVLGCYNELLNERNHCQKTPAQCYLAEPLPANDIEQLCRKAGVISIGNKRLHDEKSKLSAIRMNYNMANWKFIAQQVMEQEFIALHSGQEGDHRYAAIFGDRTKKDRSIIELLQADNADLRFMNLASMFTSREQIERDSQIETERTMAASKRTLKVYFGKDCRIKNAEEEKYVTQCLFKQPENSGSFYIANFYKGPARAGDTQDTYIIHLFKNPKNNVKQPCIFAFCKSSATFKLASSVEEVWDAKQLEKFNLDMAYTESEDRANTFLIDDSDSSSDEDSQDDLQPKF